MRRASLFLVLSLIVCTSTFAAAKLSRDLVRKRISELMDSKLLPDSIEVRRITQQSDTEAVADTTITLAFQFKTNDAGLWTVDAVRLGDRDWLSMNELLAAIYEGNPPAPATPSNPVPAKPVTPVDRFHVNPSDFEQQRRSMIELGASPLVPDAIEIRRVISQSANRAVVESTVTMSFRFRRDPRSKNWSIADARLGDRDWVSTADVLKTLNDGRRRETEAGMERLAAGISKYRDKNVSLPMVRDIVELTDLLHPAYMTDLVRVDAWGRPLDYRAEGSAFRLISRGMDGRWGTADDIIVDRRFDGPGML